MFPIAVTVVFALAISLLLLADNSLPVLVVHALPSGAAGCAKSVRAVEGFHLNYGPEKDSRREGAEGPLDMFNTMVLLNGVPVNVSAAATLTFATGTEVNWTIDNTAGNISMRGILFRVDFTSADFVVSSNDLGKTQISRFCQRERGNVTGITHVDRSDKSAVSGLMRFDAPGTVTIDVTIVYRNGRVAPGNSSYFAYNGFAVTVTGPPSPTTPRAPAAPAPTTPTAVPSCDVNGCTSLYGYKGHIMKRQRKGLCLAKCMRPWTVPLRKLVGWRCGTCGYEPE
jgi:hypothetical protein